MTHYGMTLLASPCLDLLKHSTPPLGQSPISNLKINVLPKSTLAATYWAQSSNLLVTRSGLTLRLCLKSPHISLYSALLDSYL